MMHFSRTHALRIATLLTGPALVMACSQIPRSTVDDSQFATLSCDALAHELAAAQATRAAAEQARAEAWHAVLPFVVAARYADAGAAASQAQRRIALLSHQVAQRPCAS